MSTFSSPPGSPSRPDQPPLVDRPKSGAAPWLRAWGWSASAMVIGTVAVVLVGLLDYPFDNSDGWADLVWLIYVAIAVAVVGVSAGAVTFGVRLKRTGDLHPVVTGFLVVPVALALGAVTAGVGALLAPPVAFWFVSGFSRRRAGPAGLGRHHGLAQRVVVALLLCGLAISWVIDWLGYRL